LSANLPQPTPEPASQSCGKEAWWKSILDVKNRTFALAYDTSGLTMHPNLKHAHPLMRNNGGKIAEGARSDLSSLLPIGCCGAAAIHLLPPKRIE
jgi:hypothetical protein